MISTNNMLRRIYGLIGTRDLSNWETDFVEDVWERTHGAEDVHLLSDKQVDKIEQIFEKHFAG